MASKHLDDLCPAMRERVDLLIARCLDRGVVLKIVETLRTEKEQKDYYELGKTENQTSKHLSQKTCTRCGQWGGLSHALDAEPDQGEYTGWEIYGEEAEKLGLVWGGREEEANSMHVHLP